MSDTSNHVSKQRWIDLYGGQEMLDAEGFDVVPCIDCADPACRGWRVVNKYPPSDDAVIAALLNACKVVTAFLDKLESSRDLMDRALAHIRRQVHAPLMAALEPAIKLAGQQQTTPASDTPGFPGYRMDKQNETAPLDSTRNRRFPRVGGSPRFVGVVVGGYRALRNRRDCG